MRNDVERERVDVGRDVSGGVVREHEHEQLRELVRDDVARGPTRQAEDRADGRIAPGEDEPQPNAGTGDGGHEHERP